MSNPQYENWNQKIIDEFRANNGTVSAAGFGSGLVLLHHVGAKSGETRVTPVRGIHVDVDTWLVTASKSGAPENPAWYYNLLAHPDVSIEVPDEGLVAVHVDDLSGAERDAGWAHFLAVSPAFAEYEQRTTRTIPVLALRRNTLG